jgi:hypothetical protein
MISTPEALVLQARRQFDALLALVEAARDERIDRVEGQLFGERGKDVPLKVKRRRP